MISMELHRDVPQYMAIPWLMTWVIARTVSEREREETMFGIAGAQGQPRDGLQMQVGCQEEGAGCKGILQAVYFLAPRAVVGVGKGRFPEKRKWAGNPEDKFSDKVRPAWILGRGL